jgi:hypothetical protein
MNKIAKTKTKLKETRLESIKEEKEKTKLKRTRDIIYHNKRQF